MTDFRLWDAREHRRLLAARARVVATTLRRVRRAVGGAVAGWWSADARALLATLPAATVEAPLVALADELADLVTLQARFDDHRRGDGAALDDLIDTLAARGEHLRALMPRGRLPKNPAPSVKQILDGIHDELLARLILQWAIDAPRAPEKSGAIDFAPRLSPSWGGSARALLLGRQRAFLDGKTRLPPRMRFRFARRGFSLSSAEFGLAGAFGGEWSIRAPRRTVSLLPHVGPWPILPAIVDEDGRSRSARARRTVEDHVQRIALAREVLAAAWPNGARTVDDFTRAIIPVAQSQVVSYSFAPVPGWSYLNLFDRDFVDLVDDLVHENAHHHLNHILADAPLLAGASDDNLIYYSPWRETLRPLRGILHSVFTFHAGAELFRQLWRALQEGVSLPRPFSDGERKKIAARCLEETAQVRYSLVDLERAWRRRELTARGHALALAIAADLRGFDRLAPSLRRAVAGTRWERRLAALSATLAERRAHSARLR